MPTPLASAGLLDTQFSSRTIEKEVGQPPGTAQCLSRMKSAFWNPDTAYSDRSGRDPFAQLRSIAVTAALPFFLPSSSTSRSLVLRKLSQSFSFAPCRFLYLLNFAEMLFSSGAQYALLMLPLTLVSGTTFQAAQEAPLTMFPSDRA